MKHLHLVIACSMLMQSFAWAGPKESLKAALDEYRYELTVEWDQNDKAQLDKIKSEFSNHLKKIIIEEGLTEKHLDQFIKENSHQLKVDANILQQLKDQNGRVDVGLAQEMLERHSNAIYMQGSSWAPLTTLVMGLGILFVVEMIVLLAFTTNDVCPNPDHYPNDVQYPCQY